MEKRFILLMVSLFNLIFIINSVSAFGYSSSYTVDNPLTVYPGETKDAQITLRVTPDEGNLTIRGEMLDNSSIAELIDKNLEYEIGPEKDAVVNIRLKIPKNASLGEYSIRMRFTDITPSTGGGTVGFRGGMIVTLTPRVIEKPKLATEKPTEEEKISLVWVILWLVVVAAVTAIVYFIIRVIKSKKKISEESL